MQKEGKRFQGRYIVFHYVSENFIPTCLGITVSKQFGSAVSRNLFKRRVREVFRCQKHDFPSGLKIHVSPSHNTKQPTGAQVKADFTLLLDALKAIS